MKKTAAALLCASSLAVALLSACGGSGSIVTSDRDTEITDTSFYQHRLELRGGVLYGTGDNRFGQLGLANVTKDGQPVTPPPQVSKLTQAFVGVSGITKAEAGAHFTLVLTGGGKVYSAGDNRWGQLGRELPAEKSHHADPNHEPQEVAFSEPVTITDISAGSYHSLALDSNGNVWAWGYNRFGQLGRLPQTPDVDERTVPEPVPAKVVLPPGQTAVAIAAGAYHSAAILADGTVYTWGFNRYGQLGQGTVNDGVNEVPKAVVPAAGVLQAAQIKAGGFHTIVLTADGSAYGWGSNAYGQLGLNDRNIIDRTQPVSLNFTAQQIALGGNHTLAIRNGALFSWGLNDHGQIGDRSNTNAIEPVRVDGLGAEGSNVAGIAAKGGYSVAFRNMTTWAFGDNRNGQYGDQTRESVNKPRVVLPNRFFTPVTP